MPNSAFRIAQNCPCEQCFRIIPSPSWAEARRNVISYAWQCEACRYEFETTVWFKEETPPLAA